MIVVALALLGACGGEAAGESMAASTSGAETEREPTRAQGASTSDAPRSGVRTRALFVSEADPEAESILENQTVRVRVRDDRNRPIPPGSQMRSGERFVVEIQPVRPVYVYIMYRAPNGDPAPLYPGGDRPPIRLEANAWTRIPADRYLELDDNVGEEELYVFVSERPFEELPEDDDTLRTVVAAQQGLELPPEPDIESEDVELVLYSAEALETSPEEPVDGPAVSPGRPPEQRARPRPRQQRRPRPRVAMRGFTLAEPDDELVVAPDDAGVSVIMFPITHVAR